MRLLLAMAVLTLLVAAWPRPGSDPPPLSALLCTAAIPASAVEPMLVCLAQARELRP